MAQGVELDQEATTATLVGQAERDNGGQEDCGQAKLQGSSSIQIVPKINNLYKKKCSESRMKVELSASKGNFDRWTAVYYKRSYRYKRSITKGIENKRYRSQMVTFCPRGL